MKKMVYITKEEYIRLKKAERKNRGLLIDIAQSLHDIQQGNIKRVI